MDSYLAGLPKEMKAALEQLRQTIKSAAPQAEETVSYGVPMFKLHGPLVSFGAATNHCAFYVQSPEVMDANKEELKTYDTSKGTIRFQPNKPLPVALVKKLVKARIDENTALAAKKKANWLFVDLAVRLAPDCGDDTVHPFVESLRSRG